MRKASLFFVHHLRHALGSFNQFRVRVVHQVANCIDHFVKKWFLLSEQSPVSDSAADDFSQNVAAAFIPWENTVADEKCRGARVVGDDA